MNSASVRRHNLAPDQVLCDHCTGRCCRYFALPIDTPVDRNDYENIRWYMLHGDVSVFVDDDNWYLLIHNTCDQLDHSNRCGIYDNRPTLCRTYSTANCEFDNDACYDRLFEQPEQIQEYAEALLGRRRQRGPVSLPVLEAAT
jgi:Fe-S-cluster containining protein